MIDRHKINDYASIGKAQPKVGPVQSVGQTNQILAMSTSNEQAYREMLLLLGLGVIVMDSITFLMGLKVFFATIEALTFQSCLVEEFLGSAPTPLDKPLISFIFRLTVR